MKGDFVFSSESVTEGHPDKLCDQISDAIVDEFLLHDPYSRVIAEAAVANGVVFVAARFVSTATVDIPEVARRVIRHVGYQQDDFNAKDCTVLTSLRELPPSDYQRVDERSLSDDDFERFTARNQATVFGFACDQTPSMLPLPIWLAHRLARRMSAVRLEKLLPYLAPDGKTQVAVEYQSGRPRRIHSITLLTAQRDAGQPDLDALRADLADKVIAPVFANEPLRPDERTRIFVNPDGPVVGGGPGVHSGLTGRKSAVDTYGEYARHSGAALSGKDPARIDRIGAYAARYAAKNIVAAGLASQCEVVISYAIGCARPVSVQVESFGTGVVADEEIVRRLQRHFDFRPAAIMSAFRLRWLPAERKGGFYQKLATYGHVGRRDIGLPWEQTDRAKWLQDD
jgi:S-adenosylmethionine synthetase